MIDGEIDVATAPDLGVALATISTSTEARLDLSQVTFIDSSGLRILVAEHLRRGRAGQRLVIDNPSKRVVKLLEVTGLMEQFDVRPV